MSTAADPTNRRTLLQRAKLAAAGAVIAALAVVGAVAGGDAEAVDNEAGATWHFQPAPGPDDDGSGKGGGTHASYGGTWA